MAIIKIYNQNIEEIKFEKDLLNYLTIWDNIVSSNTDKDFFVNWNNANSYIRQYSEEISLLNSILEHDDKIEKLKEIIDKYWEITKIKEVIPMLLAVSYKKVDFQLWDENFNTKLYNFSSTDQCIEFLKLTGFTKFLNTFTSIRDYVFWVKVWMDTNGRKNRSWSFNENIIKNILNEKLKNSWYEIIYQKNFWKVLDELTLSKLPSWYKRKKFDVLIKKENKYINIEINHFWWWWSKQEIADAYRSRNEDLKKSWIWFVWNTDGAWWYKIDEDENKLLTSIKDIDFITNIKMLKNTNIIHDIIKFYIN